MKKFDAVCVYNGRCDIFKHGKVFKNMECMGIFDKESDTLELKYRMMESSSKQLDKVLSSWFGGKLEPKIEKYRNPNYSYIDDETGEVCHYLNQEEFLYDYTFIITKEIERLIYDRYTLVVYGSDSHDCPYHEYRDVFYKIFWGGSDTIRELWKKFHEEPPVENTEDEYV